MTYLLYLMLGLATFAVLMAFAKAVDGWQRG